MVSPSYEKSMAASGKARAYVVKVASGLSGVFAHGKCALATRGAGAYAIGTVRNSPNECDVGAYFIITERQETNTSKRGESIKAELQTTAGSPKTEWILPLNRCLQRLFKGGLHSLSSRIF